jgi:FixJ family two-component response regulator
VAYSSRPWLPVPCLKTACFQPDAPPGEDPTISIVDDDRALRDALRQLMDSAGLAAETFASAEEFLASPSFSRTTCLILDVRLPGMDGLELQRRLVATGGKVPIVFISAHADDQTRAQALQAGAFQFFDKPFSSTALLEAIAAARHQ